MKTRFSNIPYDPATTVITDYAGWEIHTFRTRETKEELPKFCGFMVHTKTYRYCDTPVTTDSRDEILDGFKCAIDSGTIKPRAEDERKRKPRPEVPDFMAHKPKRTKGGIILP